MSARLYLVPVIGTGSKGDPRRPKYFSDGTIPGSPWTAMDYGFEPWMLVADDVPPTDDATVIGKPDAFGLPFDLTQNITVSQLANVQSKLEAANIPSNWVNTGLTWNQVVKTVCGVFMFLQRFGFIYGQQNGAPPSSIFTAGITLDATFSSLTSNTRSALVSTAQSFAIDTSSLITSSTLRKILKTVSDAFNLQTFSIGVITIP